MMKKLRKKKDCNRCKALMISDFDFTCYLGFRQHYKFRKYDKLLTPDATAIIPDEICTKPITYEDFLVQRRENEQ